MVEGRVVVGARAEKMPGLGCEVVWVRLSLLGWGILGVCWGECREVFWVEWWRERVVVGRVPKKWHGACGGMEVRS